MSLVVTNLALKRGERTILAGLTFTAVAGEAIILTGPNGTGKTTLLRAVAGLLAPSEGEIRLSEPAPSGAAANRDDEIASSAISRRPAGPSKDVGENCHFVGHLDAIKPTLSVAENAAFWASYLGGDRKNVAEALDSFRLGDLATLPAGYLSAGQKRRLGLTRLLLAKRLIWLLDEPSVSLDSASQGLLSERVNAHLTGGGIVLAATHQPLGFAPARELSLARGNEPTGGTGGGDAR